MRETKYNQNTFNKNAPIDRDALWGKISTDPQFPTPEPKSHKGFWKVGSLVFLLLISALTYTFTKVESNEADEKDSTSLNNKLVENKNDQNSTLKTQTTQEVARDTETNSTVKNVKTNSNTELHLSSNEQLSTRDQESINRNEAKRENTQTKTNANNTILESLKSNQSQNSTQTSTQGQSTTPRDIVKSEINFQASDQNNTPIGLQTITNQISALSAIKFDKLESKTINLPSYTESLSQLKSRLGLLVYLNASYGLSINSVTAIDSLTIFSDIDDVSQYLENRESRAIELGIKKQFFKRFNIGLGAEYREDWQVYKRTTQEILITEIPAEEGRIGLAEVTKKYKLPQSYKSLNLLVNAGYLIPTQIGILEIGGGLTYNISASNSGNILDNEFSLIGKTRAYELTGFGLAGFGQASLTLPLSEQLRLSFNAKYDLPILISSSKQSYEHKLSALRLGVGLGYAF